MRISDYKQDAAKRNQRNRRRGFSYESRRLKEVWQKGGYGFRAYASKGIVDIMYIDSSGIAHLEQLKFSSRGKPRISKSERGKLEKFAKRWQGCPVIISLVLKQAYRQAEEIILNQPKFDNESLRKCAVSEGADRLGKGPHKEPSE